MRLYQIPNIIVSEHGRIKPTLLDKRAPTNLEEKPPDFRVMETIDINVARRLSGALLLFFFNENLARIT